MGASTASHQGTGRTEATGRKPVSGRRAMAGFAAKLPPASWKRRSSILQSRPFRRKHEHQSNHSGNRESDSKHHAGDSRARVARNDVRGAAGADGSGERNARAQDADDARSLARRPMV